MKKILLAAAAGATVFTMSAANAAIEANQITLWVNGDKGYNGMQKVGDRYTKETGIKVTVAHPDQAEVKFMQTAATQNGPDIMMWAHDRFGEWAKAGLLTPLTIKDEVKAKFADFSWDAMTVDGKIIGYPVSIEAISLICNKALVPQAPENFEDFVKLDDELKAKGARAILWDYNTPYFSYPLIAAQGGFAFKQVDGVYDVTKTGINNDGAKKGLNWIVNMIKEDHIQAGADFGVMDSQFSQGKLGCLINGPWGWANYEQAKIDFSVNPLPKLGGQRAKAFVGVQGLAINAASPNKDLAIDFIENYLLTDEGLKDVNDDKALGVAALNSFQAVLAQDPRMSVTMDNARNGDIMPSVPEMNRFWSAFDTALKNTTSGRQKVEQALGTAEKRVVAK